MKTLKLSLFALLASVSLMSCGGGIEKQAHDLAVESCKCMKPMMDLKEKAGTVGADEAALAKLTEEMAKVEKEIEPCKKSLEEKTKKFTEANKDKKGDKELEKKVVAATIAGMKDGGCAKQAEQMEKMFQMMEEKK